MNKFEKTISANIYTLKGNRAKIVARMAKSSLYEEVRNRQKVVDEIEMDLEKLRDISPTTTISSKATSDDFDATKWAKSLATKILELKDAKEDLATVQAEYDEWFKDEESK